ncbi:hypothetical protein A9R05_41880 (plasmid) [Burkholderia sp. KK1]|uniref:hypothetical protein n=1 Tax=Burkholderia TaxID=32008 RepID=UPI000979B9C2|nr:MULTISPECIES: hypothetical protein [Burkholderia]AQH05576.1 hypothetical protein A9R05_41880 [Burkholderia sp. KK1]
MEDIDSVRREVSRHCVGVEPYKGYRSRWCGDGAVIFVGPGGDEIKGYSRAREEWMTEAWLAAKSQIDARLAGA